MNVLFVCTGNTCRSPMAEKILQKKAKENNINLYVKSAGIAASDGNPASKQARKIMREYGTDDYHKTQRVTKELLSWADLVLTMTREHKQMLIEFEPQFHDKIFTLKEYIITHSEWKEVQNDLDRLYVQMADIADPFGGDLNAYRRTAKEIEKAIDTIFKSNLFS